ncbi:MAG: hypothetical protein JSS09_09405, partial [Verrucomicrobia bacterium]|nr:hypothetical protein [Verrucomicrobiota bacterium]
MAYLEKYLQNKGKDKSAIAYLAALDYLGETHPSVAENIVQELKDQRSH